MSKSRAHRKLCSLLAAFLVLAWVWVVGGGTAFAQAEVIHATPGIEATVQQAPTTITIETTENLRPGPAGTNIFVYGPHGKLISQGDAQITPKQPRQMSVRIKNDGEGIYVVQWKTVSEEDGGTAQGAFTFTVAQEQNNFPLLAMTITGIITLIIGIVIGSGLGRNRAASAAHVAADGEHKAY